MRIAITGDVMLGRLVNEALKVKGASWPWGDTLALFKTADWRCCNLECVLSDIEPPFFRGPKVFRFRSDAKNVQVLQAARINAVGLANNHTLDFEEEALLEMLNLLDRTGIARAGAGRDWEEASRPAITRAAGQRLALFSFTDNEPGWEAGEKKPGVYYLPMDPTDSLARQLLKRVRSVRKNVDLLLVSVHWGSNWGSLPEMGHPEMARALIDAGVDVVLGHSCHILRGVEIYRGRPIFYSCGDFVDDYAVDPVERNDHSCLFLLDLDRGGALQRLRLYPTVIQGFQARRAKPHEAAGIGRMMIRLSRALGTAFHWCPPAGPLEWNAG